jgi:SHAQKYF class myb-like DNA-binding protein
MTITPAVRDQLLGPESRRVVQLPPRTTGVTETTSTDTTNEARSPEYHDQTNYIIATLSMPTLAPAPIAVTPEMTRGLPWTAEEHARFVLGLEQYPAGPWKLVAAVVGSRDARQTMSHAQKIRMKISRQNQKKERKQQRKEQSRQQRQRKGTPSTDATSTSTASDDGRQPVVSELAISTTSYASHPDQQMTALDLSVVSSGMAMAGEAVCVISNAAEDDKFDHRSNARMSPLAFDATPMPEIAAELQQFLYSEPCSTSSGFAQSYEGRME